MKLKNQKIKLVTTVTNFLRAMTVNSLRNKGFMDIWLIDTAEGTQLRPESVHGMLWLQTHFEEAHWEAIASKIVILPIEDAQALSNDAKKAGLSINYLPSIAITRKF